MAAVAKNLRHHSIQNINEQKDGLAVSRHSVRKGCPGVKRSPNMRELGLREKVKKTK